MKTTGDVFFDLFWSAYPKKVKKILAFKEWKKLKEFTVQEILAGIERWKQSAQWQDVQFIPDPERFLKYRRWEDEVPQNGTRQRINRPSGAVAPKEGKQYKQPVTLAVQ